MSQLGPTTTKSLSYLTSSLSLTSIMARPRPGGVTKYVLKNSTGNSTTASGNSSGYVVVRNRRAISTSTKHHHTSSSSSSSTAHPTSNSFRNNSNNQTNQGSREERRILRRSGSNTSPSSSFVTPSFFDPSTATSTSSAVASTSTNRSFHNHSRSSDQLQPQTSSSSSTSNSVDSVNPYQSKQSNHSHPSLLLNSSPTIDSSSLSVPSLPSTSSNSNNPFSSTSSNNNNNNNSTDRLTLFTSQPAASYPSQNLPSFFGTTTLNITRRGNLVFRNGAFGIPKAGDGVYGGGWNGKGKEKDKTEEEKERELLEHTLSVGVGEDAYFLRTDSLGVADGVGGWSGHAGSNPARWSRKLMHREFILD